MKCNPIGGTRFVLFHGETCDNTRESMLVRSIIGTMNFSTKRTVFSFREAITGLSHDKSTYSSLAEEIMRH